MLEAQMNPIRIIGDIVILLVLILATSLGMDLVSNITHVPTPEWLRNFIFYLTLIFAIEILAKRHSQNFVWEIISHSTKDKILLVIALVIFWTPAVMAGQFNFIPQWLGGLFLIVSMVLAYSLLYFLGTTRLKAGLRMLGKQKDSSNTELGSKM